jgi:hypothetical protein
VLLSFTERLNLLAFSFIKVLVHLIAGLVPESLVTHESRLVFNISELFEKAPLFVMIVLEMSRLRVLALALDPQIEFGLFFGLGFFLDV